VAAAGDGWRKVTSLKTEPNTMASNQNAENAPKQSGTQKTSTAKYFIKKSYPPWLRARLSILKSRLNQVFGED
jgi:hypothetical protein